ncbi:MAG: excisionase family DNA-binding protein [bacterium]
METRDNDAEFIGVKAAARALGVHWQTLYRRVHDGTVPAYRVGRRIIINKAALAQALVAARIGSNDGADMPDAN